MIEAAASTASPETVEIVLRQELARGDARAETVVPILRHLLANETNSVFGDDILARVRGMAEHIACQLLDELAGDDEVEGKEARITALTGAFYENAPFLAHLHALAMEWQLSERMLARFTLDPVLSPLVQALVASKDEATQALAMKALASQARFCQAQRRMTLPLSEMPGDHLHFALLCLRNLAGEGEDEAAQRAEAAIRARYDEGKTRLGMLSQLIMSMGSGAIAALSLTHAGTALFLTALAIGSGQDRDAATLSTNDGQLARLALALRSAGMKPEGVNEQFVSLHPDITLPEGFEQLGVDRAAAILAAGGSYPGG
ncbi:MAG: hypothetical protein R3D89_09255 [Sphingomonadaceae bacterium]